MDYILVLLLCVGGAWNNCSGGIKEVRIGNLPNKQICEEVKDQYLKQKRLIIQSALCIPQSRK